MKSHMNHHLMVIQVSYEVVDGLVELIDFDCLPVVVVTGIYEVNTLDFASPYNSSVLQTINKSPTLATINKDSNFAT